MVEQMREEIVHQVRAALEHEPRLNLHRFPLLIRQASDGTVVLQGETQSVAAKKLALEVAAATPGVADIIDRLHVAPARHMGDGEIRDHVRDALLQEPVFQNHIIRTASGGRDKNAPSPGLSRYIEIAVEEGVVALDGQVGSLSHKSLAGTLAWWVPGTRDVINAIDIVPPQQINDAEINDAVMLILEKDPWVNTSRIRVLTRNRIVVLEGYVSSSDEREMADMDAWCAFGVDLVMNRLEVQP